MEISNHKNEDHLGYVHEASSKIGEVADLYFGQRTITVRLRSTSPLPYKFYTS